MYSTHPEWLPRAAQILGEVSGSAGWLLTPLVGLPLVVFDPVIGRPAGIVALGYLVLLPMLLAVHPIKCVRSLRCILSDQVCVRLAPKVFNIG